MPKEAEQDYEKLVDYWLSDVSNGTETCWIIFLKGKWLFSRDKKVGFRAFEFRDSLKKARISCAIIPEFRRKSISTNSAKLVIEKLKNEGIEKIKLKHFQSANEDFDIAIKLNDNIENAYFNRHLAYQELGEKEKTFKEFIKDQQLEFNNK